MLKPAGSLWLNLGDSFSGTRNTALHQELVAAPERLLLALMDDGWIVRGKVIWTKPNALPNSVADRPNLNYEVVYFLVRPPRYFFDLDAIREPHRSRAARATAGDPSPGLGRTVGFGQSRRSAPCPASRSAGASAWKESGFGLDDSDPRLPGPALRHLPAGSDSTPDSGYLPGGHLLAAAACRGSAELSDPGAGRPSIDDPNRRPSVMRFKDRWHNVRHVGDLFPCGCGRRLCRARARPLHGSGHRWQ